jgi:hypothetical protein
MREILFAVGGQRGKQKLLQNFFNFSMSKKKVSLEHTHKNTQSRNYTGKKQITGKNKTSCCGRPVVD